jgi:cytochrome c biogenesis protein CcdA/thiol-disulfide isomerase/thioredoxin
MKNKISLWAILALVIVLAGIIPTQTANVSAQNTDVTIYYFYGDGCPFCEIAQPQLQAYADENPRINLEQFEVYYDPEGREYFFEFAAAYGFEPRAVPTILIGERYWEGFSDNIRVQIETYLNTCLTEGCTNLGEGILASEPLPPTETPMVVTPAPTETDPTPVVSETEPEQPEPPSEGDTITLPLIGTINLSGQSLLVSTLIISFVDGFNPCSLWVLSVLLSITLQTRSRKKVLIVGAAFLLTTAALYGLFIAGVFSVLRIISFIGWIQVVVALIALTFALVNIKDYFWFQEGVSFTISDKKKPGIYQRMRRILRESDSAWQLIAATVVFAAGIALVELTCTAGFPVIWSNIMASQQVATATFILLLLVYMLVYLLDEAGIFLVAVFTLRSTKLEEKHGRVLKLIGGVLMLTLALVMLIDPTVMNDISGTLIIFGLAIGATALILLIHRVILPGFNIRIGSEQ